MTIEELSKLMKEGFEQIQRQFEDVNRRLGHLETDVAWIKGTQEGRASVWQIITTATAVDVQCVFTRLTIDSKPKSLTLDDA